MAKPDQTQDLIELVKRAQSGDEAAFEQLYAHYYAPIVRFCVLRVGDRDEAEDLAQKTFLKFYKNLPGWRDQGYGPAAYLYTVARSVLADYYRANARYTKLDSSEEILSLLPDQSQDSVSSVINREEVEAVLKLLQKMDPAEADVLQLRYIEGLPTDEIAQIIGKSGVATRKAISRALQKLRLMVEANKEFD